MPKPGTPLLSVNVPREGGRLGIRDGNAAAFVSVSSRGGSATGSFAALTSTFAVAAEFTANPARNAPRFAAVGTTARALIVAPGTPNFPFAAGSTLSGVNLPSTWLALITTFLPALPIAFVPKTTGTAAEAGRSVLTARGVQPIRLPMPIHCTGAAVHIP